MTTHETQSLTAEHFAELLREVIEQQNLAAQAHKRAQRHARNALQYTKEAETRLKRILEQYGIDLEIKSA